MKIGDRVKVIKLYDEDIGLELGYTGVIVGDFSFNDGSFLDVFNVKLDTDVRRFAHLNNNIFADGSYDCFRGQLEVIEETK